MNAQQTTPWIFRPKVITKEGDSVLIEAHKVSELELKSKLITLILFPPAGTGATIYNSWVECLSKQLQSSCPDWCDGFRILPVELPGRGMRMKEMLLENMDEVVDGVVNALTSTFLAKGYTSPIVVLGHSMGSWVAFETVRKLENRHQNNIMCLITSGVRSPRLSGVANDIDSTAMHTLDDEEFWVKMEERYGKNKELEHPSVRKFMYPILKADFSIAETYSPEFDACVSCPLFVSGGKADVRYTRDMLDAWVPCTKSALCDIQMFDGGHSYLFSMDESCQSHIDFVLQGIQAALVDYHQDNQHQHEDVQSKKSLPDTNKSTSDIDAMSTMGQAPETMSISSHGMTEHSFYAPSPTLTSPFDTKESQLNKDVGGCSCTII
jgi:surfactin synthase thioesterase subunit